MSRPLLSLSLAAILLLDLAGDAAARCLEAKERAAVDVRVVQTELMVAALSCRAVPGRDFTNAYNAFMQTYGATLADYGRTLKAYFADSYGSRGEEELNAFITSVANDASRRSMDKTAFCDNARVLYQEVGALQPQHLESWAWVRAASGSVDLPVCPGADRPQAASNR